MDTAAYYITRKGEKLGPYRFYQLQQLKTEDHFDPEDFHPHEWQEFVELVEGRTEQTTFIRRVEKGKEKPHYFLRSVTFLGYAAGIAVIIAGLIQGKQDLILRTQPMLYLGLFFSAAICHTIVDRFSIRRLERSIPKSKAPLLLWLAFGMIPLTAIIALTDLAMRLFFQEQDFGKETLQVGILFLAAGLVASLYRPLYLSILAVDQHLPKRKVYSLPWIGILLVVLCLAGMYFAGPEKLPAQVSEVHWHLFASSSEKTAGSEMTWRLPIHLSAKSKAVERAFGAPQKIVQQDHIYTDSGIRLSFMKDAVIKMRFENVAGSPYRENKIIGNLTLTTSSDSFMQELGMPDATFNEKSTKTFVWARDSYELQACFRSANSGNALETESVQWVEFIRKDQSILSPTSL